MARRLAYTLAGALAVLLTTAPAASAAPAPPLVNLSCAGQGTLVTLLGHETRHHGHYLCAGSEGAVLLDASRAFQGLDASVGSDGGTVAQDFR